MELVEQLKHVYSYNEIYELLYVRYRLTISKHI